MSETKNQVALITGGSRGIGQAICKRLARDGFSVVVNYLSRRDDAEEVSQAIAHDGGRAWPIQADVTQPVAVREMFEEIKRREGRLDVLVNNAGRVHEALFALTPAERFQEMLQANLMSVVLCSQAALRLMLKQRHGHIINISSVSAMRAPVGLSAYAASKAAVNALTLSLAREVAGSGIRVNAIAPSLVETEMTLTTNSGVRDFRIERNPMKRMARTDEVAAAVSALLREDLTYLVGQVVVLDGGGVS